MDEHVDALVAHLAAPQLGVLTIDQSRSVGLTDRMRQQRLKDGRLIKASPQTLRLPSAPVTWQQRAFASFLDAGPEAVISHLAAAAWHRFPGIAPGAVEVTVPAGSRRGRSVGGLMHRSRDLVRADVQGSDLVRVTTPARTIIDIAPRLTFRQLQDCLDWSCREGVLSIPYLERRIAALRRPGRPGISRTAELIRLSTSSGTTAGSRLERLALAIISRADLPIPELQKMFTIDGRRFYVDFFYPQAKLAIEVSGYGTHSSRREMQHDAERAALITGLGCQVVTFTYEDVTERPDYVAGTIRRFLGL